MSKILIATGDRLEQLGRRLRRRGQRAEVVRRVTIADLESAGWAGIEPTFVLSTGRAGTRLLTELLEASMSVDAWHVPRPELVRSSRLAFERGDAEPAVFDEVLKASREELIVEAARRGHRYVETNNRITFFAPAALRCFPDARFIHLVRHPADIVRSGMRRGWYEGGHAHDIGRIRPAPEDVPDWEARDRIWKIGWMWNATCAFVERHLGDLPAERLVTVRAEDLFADADVASGLLDFCGATPPPRAAVEARLERPVNAQATGSFPRLEDWTEEQRSLLRDAAPLAGRYGYTI